MITIRIERAGDREMLADLDALGDQIDDPRDALALIGEDLASRLQRNLRTEGRSIGATWPELHPATQKIRRHYGHNGRRMQRGGDLLHSVRVLEVTSDHVDAGSRLPYALLTHTGGRNRQGRTVQAFPWLAVSDQDLDEMGETLLDAIDGGAFG